MQSKGSVAGVTDFDAISKLPCNAGFADNGEATEL